MKSTGKIYDYVIKTEKTIWVENLAGDNIEVIATDMQDHVLITVSTKQQKEVDE